MSDINATLRLTVKEDVTSKMKGAQKEILNLQGAADKTKQAVSGMFQQLIGPAAGLGAGAALGLIVSKSLQAASALEGVERRAGAVFEDALPGVTREAEAMGAAFHRSSSDMLGMEAGFGGILKGLNIVGDPMRAMSRDLTQLSVDFGAFFRVSDDEAFNVMQGAVLGQTKALQRYGIILNDSTLQEYAHSKGIKDKTSEMSEAQQMLLRYGFLMEKTKNVQGEAAASTENFSNSVKEFQGTWQDMLETAGTPLLPIVSKAFGGVTEFIGGLGAEVHALGEDFRSVLSYIDNVSGGYLTGVSDRINTIFGAGKTDNTLDLTSPAFSDLTGESFKKVGKQAIESTVDVNKLYGSLADPNRGSEKAAEKLKAVKDAMADLSKTYSDSARTVVQKLVDLDSSHRDKMKGFRDEIDQTKKSIQDLESQYSRSLDEMDKRDADTLIQAGDAITDLEKKLEDFNRKRESIYQNGGSIGVDLQDDIDKTTSELARLKAAQQKGLDSSPDGVREQFDNRFGMTDLERSLADSQARREQMKTEFDERNAQYTTEMQAIKDKQTAEETAYSSARNQLLLTKSALADFSTDYTLKMTDLSKVTEDTVDGMKTKLDELRETIGSIDALLQANATITGGGTLAERSAARGGQRLSDLPHFGDGGRVLGTTLAVIGEKGPETIVPDGKAMPGASITFGNIIIQGANADPQQIAREVLRVVTREIEKIPALAK